MYIKKIKAEWSQLPISLSDIYWLDEEFTCLASIPRQGCFFGGFFLGFFKSSNSNHSKVLVSMIRLFCENCNVCISEAGQSNCPG